MNSQLECEMRKILISSGIENIIPLGRTFTELGYIAKLFDYNHAISPIDEYMFKPGNNILRALGISKERPLGRASRFRSDWYRLDKLRSLIDEFKPEILLVERGFALPEDFLKEMKRDHNVIVTIAWWTKGLQWLDLAVKDASLYDYYFFIHRSFVANCRNRGMNNCFYLPYAADKELFKKIALSGEEFRKYRCDVAFVGDWYPNRQEILRKIVMECRYDIRIWGPKWRRKNIGRFEIFNAVKGSGLYGNELVKQYNAAKVNLNVSKWFGKSDSGLNLRIFEIPRCGSFLITDYIEELEEYYKVGEEIETYKNIEELKDKIVFYLRNDVAREEVARRGHEKAVKMPGWRERILEMMEVVLKRHHV